MNLIPSDTNRPLRTLSSYKLVFLDLRSEEHTEVDIMHKKEQRSMNNMLFKSGQVSIIMK